MSIRKKLSPPPIVSYSEAQIQTHPPLFIKKNVIWFHKLFTEVLSDLQNLFLTDIKYKGHKGNGNRQDSVVVVGQCDN